MTALMEPDPLTFRPLQPGDTGWIIHRHGVAIAPEFGWNMEFEALCAGILADFIKGFKPDCEASWIAERGGDILGSLFLIREDDATARLRLLYVEPSARGREAGGGVGIAKGPGPGQGLAQRIEMQVLDQRLAVPEHAREHPRGGVLVGQDGAAGVGQRGQLALAAAAGAVGEGGGLDLAVVGDGGGEQLRLTGQAAEGVPLVLGGGDSEQAVGAIDPVDHLAQAATAGLAVNGP